MFSGRGGSRNYRISGRGGGPSLTDVLVIFYLLLHKGAQWLSGRVLDLRPKGRGFEPHRRHCVVSLSKNMNPSLVLVQPRKTRPYITERLLMGRKESNQTNKTYFYRVFQLTIPRELNFPTGRVGKSKFLGVVG